MLQEVSLSNKDAERVIEALLFTSSEPFLIKDLEKYLPQNVDVESVIETLHRHYETRGINIKRVGASIVLRTAKDLGFGRRIWINRYKKQGDLSYKPDAEISDMRRLHEQL